MLKAIIFDFGGVFSVEADIKKFLQNNAIKFKIDPEEVNKISSAIWAEARLGKIDSNIFWEKLCELVGMDSLEFKKYFIENTTLVEYNLYDFVKYNLKGKYKLAILSNQIESWLETVLEENNFREVFDFVITSYNTGLAKPDLAIYQKTLEILDLKAEECLFIDDLAQNLVPAQTLGMQTILFENYEQFLGELNKVLKN